MKVILPARGEFGLKVYQHVPAVHAIPGPKIVLHEPGEEALYPSATELVEVPRADDDAKRGVTARGDQWWRMASTRWPRAEIVESTASMPRERFMPEPHEPVFGIPASVVACPRFRRYGASKNWPYWPALVGSLRARGVSVMVAGMRETSIDCGPPRTWDHPRPLDATIAAMRTARLVIATDAGLAHLAVLCGAPLLMISWGDGLTAPGPVVDATGKAMARQYGPIKLHRYEEANHTGSPVDVMPDTWHDPEAVLARVLEIVG